MKTFSIRELRAPLLRDLAAEGELAAITDNRVLAGIFCPVTQDWLTHTLTMNRSRIRQSVRQGEKNLANLDSLHSLDSLAGDEPVDDSGTPASTHWNPIDAVQEVLGAVMDAARNPSAGAGSEHKTVGIRDLSAAEIREASKVGRTLAVTDRHELLGVIVPVTDRFVAHVVEDNLSRIRRNIVRGERELRAGATQTLDDLG